MLAGGSKQGNELAVEARSVPGGFLAVDPGGDAVAQLRERLPRPGCACRVRRRYAPRASARHAPERCAGWNIGDGVGRLEHARGKRGGGDDRGSTPATPSWPVHLRNVIALSFGCQETGVTDEDGHGTHVAGLSCATADNQIAITSIGFGCSIHADQVRPQLHLDHQLDLRGRRPRKRRDQHELRGASPKKRQGGPDLAAGPGQAQRQGLGAGCRLAERPRGRARALLKALDERIDETDSEEERSRLEELRAVARDVGVNTLSSLLANPESFPHGPSISRPIPVGECSCTHPIGGFAPQRKLVTTLPFPREIVFPPDVEKADWNGCRPRGRCGRANRRVG